MLYQYVSNSKFSSINQSKSLNQDEMNHLAHKVSISSLSLWQLPCTHSGRLGSLWWISLPALSQSALGFHPVAMDVRDIVTGEGVSTQCKCASDNGWQCIAMALGVHPVQVAMDVKDSHREERRDKEFWWSVNQASNYLHNRQKGVRIHNRIIDMGQTQNAGM